MGAQGLKKTFIAAGQEEKNTTTLTVQQNDPYRGKGSTAGTSQQQQAAFSTDQQLTANLAQACAINISSITSLKRSHCGGNEDAPCKLPCTLAILLSLKET